MVGRVTVGRAKVNVDAELNTLSLKKVGQQIRAQLEAISARNSRFYRALGTDLVTAWRAALGAIVTSAPLMGSAISALTGGVTMLAGALWSTVTAATAALPLITSLGIAAGTSRIAFTGFGDAIAAADPEALAEALENLSPAAAASALAVRSLRDEAHNLRLVVQEKFFDGLSGSIEQLATTLLPVATTGFSKMAVVLNGLAGSILDYVNSSAGLAVINDLFTNSARIISALSGAVIPFLDGFLRLVNALSPAAERLAGRIADVARQFQDWTTGEGFAERIDTAMRKAEKTAGLLFDVLGNLGGIIRNIFEAANPATNTFLEMLSDVTGRFKEFTGSVEGQESIAKWASESVEVLRQFGNTIRSVFEVLQDLADPRVITSFLVTVQSAFEHLGNLPLEQIVSTFADLAEALQPISGAMLAIIIAGVSLQMMLGNLIGQVAGAAGVWAGFRGIITKIGNPIDKVRGGFASLGSSAGKSTSAFGKFSAALGKVAGILAKGLKFAGLVGLGVTIVSVISKSEELQGKLKAVWDSIKNVFSSLGGSLSSVGKSAGPLLSALEPVFNIFEKIVGIGVGLVLDAIKFAFDSLAKVVEGAGTVVSGFLKVLTGIFTLDFSAVLDGLKTMISGVPALLEGLAGLFVSFFAPARLASLGSKLFGGLLSGMRTAFPAVTSAVSGFITSILSFFTSLGSRLLSAGLSAIRGLGTGISTGFTAVRTIIADFITGFVTVLQTGFTLVSNVVSVAMNGIRTVFTTVWNAIRSLIGAVWGGITSLITAALNVIRTIITTVMTAIRTTITTVWNAIKAVITTVVNGIRSVITTVWNAIRSTVTSVVNGIRSTVSSVWNSIRSIISSVMSGIRSIISSVWSSIRSTVTSVVNGIRSVVTSVWNAIRSTTSSVFNSIRSLLTSIWNGIRSTITNVLNGIKSAISAAWNVVRNVTTNAFNAFKNIISSAINNVLSLIRGIPGKITSALGNLGGLLVNAGRDLIGGLVKGITGGIGKIGSAMGGVTKKIRSFLPFSPVKEGPLRAWNNGKPGKTLMAMLAKGIDDGQKDVERSVGRMAGLINGATPSSMALPAIMGSPHYRTRTSAPTASEAPSNGPAGGVTHISVMLNMDDLRSLQTLEDFLEMLDVRRRMEQGV